MRKTLSFLLLLVSIVTSAQKFTYTAVGGNIYLEAESRAMITEYNESCTFNKCSLAADSISKGAYLDIMPTYATANWAMTYRLNSALSGTCDLYVVVLPKTILGPDGNKRPCKFKATINYIDDDGKAATYECGTFVTDPYCVDTVKVATFTFPASNLNQAYDTPSLTLKCNITGKETPKYNREMFLDCILLHPLESLDNRTLNYNILDKEAKTCEVSANPDWLGDLFIPEKVQYEQSEYTVTAIGDNAFYGCNGLISVDIPTSVTKIGNSAFEGCISMTEIDIPTSVTAIGDAAFQTCKGLTSVDIPASVTKIGNSTFMECTGMTEVNIPSSVTEIGDYAFYNCKGLTSVDIPTSVTKIGNAAFSNCIGLTEVNTHDIAAWCNINFGTAGSNPMCHAQALKLNGEEITNLVIPSSVTAIGDYAFYNCSGLTSVDIPTSVTKIGSEAFTGCIGLTEVNTHDIAAWCNINFGTSGSNPMCHAQALKLNGEEIEITNLVIPSSVTEIGNCAFMGFKSLTSVDIPASVTKIGDWAFHGCTGLTEVNIHDIAAWCNINFGTSSSNPMHYAQSLKLNGEEITNLVIPSSVTAIGDYAFEYCSGLTSVDIPASVTKIGSEAFTCCTGLTEVNIPNSVTKIEDGTFRDCDGLISVDIPASVTEIGNRAFSNCSGLTSVDIPSSVTKIGSEAFSNCSDLKKVNIPNSVTKIEDGTFHNCRSLRKINIPASVTEIGNQAFYKCANLMMIYSLNPTPPMVDNRYCFDINYHAFAMLYVPQEAVEAYRTADVWKNFSFIEGIDVTEVTNVNATGNDADRVYYDMSGRRLNAPIKGLNIINGKKVIVK